MSKLGKILLWVALVGAVVAVGVGVALVLQYADTRKTLSDTQTAKATDEQTITKDKAEYTALTAAKAKTDSDLATANSNITDLNTQLDAAKKQASDSATALQTANDAVKAEQDKLD